MITLLSNEFLEFPAKTVQSSDRKQCQLGISVLQHGCLTGEVLKCLLDTISLPRKNEVLPFSLVILAILHDIGKVNPEFLRRLINNLSLEYKNEAMQRWGDLIRVNQQHTETYHSLISYAVLKDMGACEADQRVVGEHHGFPINERIAPADCEIFGGKDWEIARRRIAQEAICRSGVDPVFPKPVKERPLKKWQVELWIGLVIVSDWLASQVEQPIPAGTEAAKAREIVANAGFLSIPELADKPFQTIFGFEPRSPQQLLFNAYQGPGIYILEAPTGCGKTEAALALAFKAMAHGDASGIYFALPTQLTSNRVHERVEKAVKNFLGDELPVRLVHSGARFMLTRWGKEASAGEEWGRPTRRALLSPFGVGTVDQALLSLLHVKFRQVRLAGLAGKVVIFDEIHSYDDYTNTLIAHLIRTLEAFGAVVVILSATLTYEGLKKLVGEDIKSPQAPIALTVKTKETTHQAELTAVSDHSVAVKLLQTSQAEDLAFQEALKRVHRGEQVLWIENTVGAEQSIYQKALTAGIETGVLHSRFRPLDREDAEGIWTNLFGKAGRNERGKCGRLLIGTQVVEQSLDLDSDFLITRLAPIDLLVQRWGRLWRHEDTKRPSECKRAESWVLAAPESIARERSDSRFGQSALVYHPYILSRTLEVLKNNSDQSGDSLLKLPYTVRRLLEEVFSMRNEEEGSENAALQQDLIRQIKAKQLQAEGALSVTHLVDEQAAEAMTRLITIPTYEALILLPKDIEVLRQAKTFSELCVELEFRVVKSPKQIQEETKGFDGHHSKLRLSEDMMRKLLRAKRFTQVVVLYGDDQGHLWSLQNEVPKLKNGKSIHYSLKVGLELI